MLLSVRIGGTGDIANVYLGLLHGFRSREQETTEIHKHQFKALAVLSSVVRVLKKRRETLDVSICFITKNPFNSPIFKTNFIFKVNNSVVSMLYTLVKHTTMSQSESLIKWFK